MSDETDSDLWIQRLRDGDDDAIDRFWSEYGEVLMRVAERQLASWLKRKIDPEDIVQSACRTFFRRMQAGDYTLNDSGDLWRLMLTITLNKARSQARFHSRQRRGADRERELNEQVVTGTMDEAIEAVDFADTLEKVFAVLSDENQRILQLSLDGKSQSEIAGDLQCSERTVRRMQVRIREQLSGMVAEGP